MTVEPSRVSNESIVIALKTFENILTSSDYEIALIDAMAHPINRGLDAASCILRHHATGRDYFLKALNGATLKEINVADTHRLASLAGESGIGPLLVASDEANGAFLFECLPEGWKFGTVKDFRASTVRASALGHLKSLHETGPLSSSRSLFDRIGTLQVELSRFDTKNDGSVYPEFYHSMADCTQRIAQAFVAAGFDQSPCKVENSLSNFMINPLGEMKLVDFDRSANADPLSDIASLCNEYCRTDSDIEEAVEIYNGKMNRSVTARIKLNMVAAAFHLGLWGIVSQYRSPKTEIEYSKYGQNQFSRCRWAIHSWDIGKLIRDM